MKKQSHLEINKKKAKGGVIMHQKLLEHGQYNLVLMPLADLPLEERIDAIVAKSNLMGFSGVDVIRDRDRILIFTSIHAIKVG